MEIIALNPAELDIPTFSSVYAEVYPEIKNRPLAEDLDFEHLSQIFLASKGAKIVGRLVVYTNPNLLYNGLNTALIGNYECIDDRELSNKLFMDALDYLKRKEIKYVIGPMNGSTWYNYRFSEHNNHTNFFLEPYHPLYYNNQWSDMGFKPLAKYLSSIDTALAYENDFVSIREKQFKEDGIVFRNIHSAHYEDEIRIIYEFSLEAFKDNFLYTPISWDIFIHKYKKLQSLLNPEHVIIAEDNNTCIGFVFCIDNLTSKETKSLILKTIAVKNHLKYKGLGQILSSKVVQYAKQNQYKNIIHAFMKDDNVSSNMSRKHAAVPYKSYVLYALTL